ncbi:hypothetical protein Tco_0836944 [Tanacetum coccineum]
METKDVQAMKYQMSKAKERCMAYFRSFHSHLQVLSTEDLKGTHIKHGFKRAYMSLFGQDDDAFTSTMLLNFTLDYDSQMADKYFAEYTGIKVKQFIETLLQHMTNVKKSIAERTCHKRLYDRRMNKRQMETQESKVELRKELDTSLVVTESSGIESGKQDTSSKLGNDADVYKADIKPVYDKGPMAEVQLTVECNIFATGQQHAEQPKIINEGRVDQYTEECQVESSLLSSSLDNKTTEFSNQSLESENICLKKTVAQFQKDFSRMETHYEIETINIELEHSVATLLKENETLKKHYKDLYDSIKITRSKTIEHTTSLLANTADLKAQIQEKVFAIAALKNDLRKLKGNSVDTKFAKTSVLGKPVLQSLRN